MGNELLDPVSMFNRMRRSIFTSTESNLHQPLAESKGPGGRGGVAGLAVACRQNVGSTEVGPEEHFV